MNPDMLTREGISNEPGWHTRLREEYNNLKDRYEKLHRTIVTIEAGTCDFRPKCSIDLLKKQAKAMGEYLYALEVRAEVEGICLIEY